MQALEALLQLWDAGAGAQEPLIAVRLTQVAQLLLGPMLIPSQQLLGQGFNG